MSMRALGLLTIGIVGFVCGCGGARGMPDAATGIGGNGGSGGGGSGGLGGGSGGTGGSVADLSIAGASDAGGGSHPDGGGYSPTLSFTNLVVSSYAVDETSSAITFTAHLSDTKGASDILGGELVSTDGTLHYGKYVAGASGTYTLTVSWSAVNLVDPITFLKGLRRDFESDFYDQAGNKVFRVVTLGFACSDGSSACAGNCKTMGSADSSGDCGGCNLSCGAHACVDEQCSTTLTLVTLTDFAHPTCAVACAEAGLTCHAACGSSHWASDISGTLGYACGDTQQNKNTSCCCGP